MNILTIGTGSSFLTEKKDSPSNSIERHKLISAGVSKLCVAILINKNEYLEVDITDKFKVHQIPFKNFLSIHHAFKLCSKICTEEKIDVISTQSPFFPGIIGFILKKKLGIPLNIQIHGDYIDNKWWIKQSKIRFLWNKWAKWVLKRSDTIRTVNPEIRKQMTNLGIKEEIIIDFPVFLELEKFKENAKDLRYKYENYKNIILFVGFLIPIKGVDVLIKAASIALKKYPETLFLIVGDGNEKICLKKLAETLKISQNIIFEGNVPYKDISSYFKTCDIFVLPSRSESWGRVVIESMVFGKPVIVSDGCKISNLIYKRDTGLVFKVDDSESLAEKIIYLIENENFSKTLGNAGKQMVVNNYSEAALIPKYYETWKRTIEEAKK